MIVLVSDADYKHTLGAVRSLGQKGIRVIAGSSRKYSQSFYSKFCSERLIYPSPQNETEFVQFMLRFINDNKIDVFLPISYDVTMLLSKHKNIFSQYTRIPVSDYESMSVAGNKDKTVDFAKNVGIITPEIYENYGDVKQFPVVVKGVKGSGNVRYVNSPEELSKIQTSGSIIEEYIPGEGYGFYALFNKGDARAIFMHKRIREYPITGGSSTAAESIYDDRLKELGLKLLTALHWHGVAMVEFKKDSRDGEFKLMEINPKFWGSLDLSIASGVDFPYLLVKMAVEGDIKPVLTYNKHIKYRWLFPDDIIHLCAKPRSAGAFLHDFFDKNTKSNVWLSDIKPNLFQIFTTFYSIVFKTFKKDFRYPHGKPNNLHNKP
jgi:predicted ATP-grasp superfamily ATP-dependent carboligase